MPLFDLCHFFRNFGKMVEWEQTDAICRWLATFEEVDDEFLAEPNKLLNGHVFAHVYNQLSNDKIDISSLKSLSSEQDWVNSLLNMRQISSHITGLLKENNIEFSVDLSKLTRKKDQHEMWLFLKCFLYYGFIAPQKKKAIAQVRTLDKTIQVHIQSILKEFMEKKNATHSVQKQNKAEDTEQKEKLQETTKELEQLKTKFESLQSEINQKSQVIDQLGADVASKMANELQEVKNQYNIEHTKNEEIQSTLKQLEEQKEMRMKQIEDLKREETELTTQIKNDAQSDLSVPQLDAKLLILKQKVLNEASDRKSNSTDGLEDIVNRLELDSRRKEVNLLLTDVNELKRKDQNLSAELTALKSTLKVETNKASAKLLQRIAQLNAEMDASPLGEAKRTSFKYKKVMQKLDHEIKILESQEASMELGILQNELQVMAQRKAEESDLLAKKLSFMQATSEQCDLRLQRLMLHVGLQMHSNRLKRWKNCLTIQEGSS